MCCYNETFRARISEHDDEAKEGIVTVINDKVESLKRTLRHEEGFISSDVELKEASWRASVGAYEYIEARRNDALPYR